MVLQIGHPGSSTVCSFPVQTDDTITIGSGSMAVLRIESPQIADMHALIDLNTGKPVIYDMGSGFGTRLNGETIDTVLPLRPGDTIELAGIPIVVSAKAVSTAPAPSPASAAPSKVVCEACEGAGMVRKKGWFVSSMVYCTACDGTGLVRRRG